MDELVQKAIDTEAKVHQQNRSQDILDSWIGKSVKFADPWGVTHEAFITYCFSVGDDDKPMCVNLVYVSDDNDKTDQYGRQITRHTSVMRRNEFTAHGIWFEVE